MRCSPRERVCPIAFHPFRAVVSRREKMLEEPLGTIEKVAGDELRPRHGAHPASMRTIVARATGRKRERGSTTGPILVATSRATDVSTPDDAEFRYTSAMD